MTTASGRVLLRRQLHHRPVDQVRPVDAGARGIVVRVDLRMGLALLFAACGGPPVPVWTTDPGMVRTDPTFTRQFDFPLYRAGDMIEIDLTPAI